MSPKISTYLILENYSFTGIFWRHLTAIFVNLVNTSQALFSALRHCRVDTDNDAGVNHDIEIFKFFFCFSLFQKKLQLVERG